MEGGDDDDEQQQQQQQQQQEEDVIVLWEREETSKLEIPLPPESSNKTLVLRQYGSNDDRYGIHSCVWDSGIAVLHYLVERRNRNRINDIVANDNSISSLAENTLVVDIGSGTGVVGLGMAISLGYHAILTDLPEALDLLNENIALNENMIKNGCVVKANELSWGGDSLPRPIVDMIQAAQRVIVVGADIVYRIPLFDPLLTTLRQIFDLRPDVDCLLGSQSIRTHLAEFYERAEAVGFQLSLQAKVFVPEGLPSTDERMKPKIFWIDSASQLVGSSNGKDKQTVVEIVKVSV